MKTEMSQLGHFSQDLWVIFVEKKSKMEMLPLLKTSKYQTYMITSCSTLYLWESAADLTRCSVSTSLNFCIVIVAIQYESYGDSCLTLHFHYQYILMHLCTTKNENSLTELQPSQIILLNVYRKGRQKKYNLNISYKSVSVNLQ